MVQGSDAANQFRHFFTGLIEAETKSEAGAPYVRDDVPGFELMGNGFSVRLVEGQKIPTPVVIGRHDQSGRVQGGAIGRQVKKGTLKALGVGMDRINSNPSPVSHRMTAFSR